VKKKLDPSFLAMHHRSPMTSFRVSIVKLPSEGEQSGPAEKERWHVRVLMDGKVTVDYIAEGRRAEAVANAFSIALPPGCESLTEGFLRTLNRAASQ
jgi:hypothetical protein